MPAHVDIADAGGGAGAWDVSVETTLAPTGAVLQVPPTVSVPGVLDVSAAVYAQTRRKAT